MLQCQVDTACDERGPENEGDDLKAKGVIVPRIRIHQDPSDVAGELEATADEKPDEPCPGASFDAESKLDDRAKSKYNAEDDVASKIGVVAVGRIFDRTLRCHTNAVSKRHFRKLKIQRNARIEDIKDDWRSAIIYSAVLSSYSCFVAAGLTSTHLRRISRQ